MLEVVLSNRFKRDLKRAVRRGRDTALLEKTVNTLAERRPLPESSRDHALTGDWTGYRECHIQPDWLLIYKVHEEELLLLLMRTGTHADLFES
ncbi:MAG: type II toxin-antitoxin system YafQ family toxin [Oscillospiraceae bacterium]|nr:type II toxin-antitoxin system YafQ family toxin [Oscillospiraceae bacterium]